jgi:hypothetical protein
MDKIRTALHLVAFFAAWLAPWLYLALPALR